jgi:CheY-like chemotaxis protein
MKSETLVILLVEDNPAHAELVFRSLAQYQPASQIHYVNNGQAALDYLYRRGTFADPTSSPRPNVILLDLRLPKQSGLEVLQSIKTDAELRCIPVVILTTSEAERDLAYAYEHRVNSYLVKPINFDKFTKLMHNLGQYWLVQNRTPCIEEAQ